MLINRTDPKELYNYLSYPYAVKPTSWQQTAAKVAMIVVHILLSIVSFGRYAIKTKEQYLADKRLNEFFVSDANDMSMFLSHIRKHNKIHFQYDEGRFSGVSKEQFDRLNENEKQSFVDGLEIVIAQEDLKEKYLKEVNVLRTLRNEIILSLNVSVNGFSLPKDVLEKLILGRTSPNQVEAARLVNRQFKNAATHLAKILSINNGCLNLKEAIPPTITNADQAIQWLEKNTACQHLTYADFKGFADFNEKHLEKLTQICPNLSHLFIKSNKIVKIEKLPPLLRVLQLDACRQLTELTELPASLTVLECCCCDTLRKLPNLPASLRVLDCTGCLALRKLPELFLTSLTELRCQSCIRLIELPELPSSLTKLRCNYCLWLTKLPELFSTSLTELDCSNCCRVEELPALPDWLIKLNCSRCDKLTLLPKLPASLTELNCSLSYALTDLPDLPASLKKLYCDGCDALKNRPESTPSLTVYK